MNDLNVWRQKDGREILIVDLEDNHLMNILKYIENCNFTMTKICGGGYDPDSYDYDEIDLKPIYNSLLTEAKRRGLKL